VRLVAGNERVPLHDEGDDIGVEQPDGHGSAFLVAGGLHVFQEYVEFHVVCPQAAPAAQETVEGCGLRNALLGD